MSVLRNEASVTDDTCTGFEGEQHPGVAESVGLDPFQSRNSATLSYDRSTRVHLGLDRLPVDGLEPVPPEEPGLEGEAEDPLDAEVTRPAAGSTRTQPASLELRPRRCAPRRGPHITCRAPQPRPRGPSSGTWTARSTRLRPWRRSSRPRHRLDERPDRATSGCGPAALYDLGHQRPVSAWRSRWMSASSWTESPEPTSWSLPSSARAARPCCR